MSDVDLVRKFAGNDHDHNTSNHRHSSAATADTDDYNDPHERRLLIADVRRGCVCCRPGRLGRIRVIRI